MLWFGEKEEEEGRRWQIIRKASSAFAFALASLTQRVARYAYNVIAQPRIEKEGATHNNNTHFRLRPRKSIGCEGLNVIPYDLHMGFLNRHAEVRPLRGVPKLERGSACDAFVNSNAAIV